MPPYTGKQNMYYQSCDHCCVQSVRVLFKKHQVRSILTLLFWLFSYVCMM